MMRLRRNAPFLFLCFVNIILPSLSISAATAKSSVISGGCQDDSSSVNFLDDLKTKYHYQPIFLQAVEEMALSLKSLFDDSKLGEFYKRAFLAIAEPERIISFRVPWIDDEGTMRINRGWRVEFSSVLGPYKGGLRFHPTVDEGVLKFLGFEQIFKNALTGLPLGGGKGGSDFDPKGKSDGEVQRFCSSFMTELYRHIGPSVDVPAGDIGVGGREIGFLLGQYKRITNKHGEGVLTGKPLVTGGSLLRPQATGYGLVYIARLAILKRNLTLNGAKCAVSGSGNVAQYAAEKLIEFGATVMTMSDSGGVLFFENGMTEEDLDIIVQAKQVDRSRLSSIEHKVTGKFVPHHSPWSLVTLLSPEFSGFDYGFPCATQNEIDGLLMEKNLNAGMVGVFEGANLPVTLEGQKVLKATGGKVVYIPGKAANAGGVGVSGFEMSQNAQHLSWQAEEVDNKLQMLMEQIYNQLENGGDGTSLESGANMVGFLKVVNGMKDLGWVL